MQECTLQHHSCQGRPPDGDRLPVLPCTLRDVEDVDRRDTRMVKPRARGLLAAQAV
jgi:hypothetical protein